MPVNYFLIPKMLLLVSGLTIDAGLLERRIIALQTAAHAAAQEGLLDLVRNTSRWSAHAVAQATQNGFTTGTNNLTVTIASPPTFGASTVDASAVQATLSQSVHTIFMGWVSGGMSIVTSPLHWEDGALVQ